MIENCTVVDVFCGVGGLTHGFVLEGFNVIAGIDSDPACKFPYEANNPGSRFINSRIEDLSIDDVKGLFPKDHIKILVGCAPCQPYSSYNHRKVDRNDKWKLVSIFGDLICSLEPDVVSMENVPDLATFKKGRIYKDFLTKLGKAGYIITNRPEIYCPDYGIPQQRTRLVMFASKSWGVELISPTHTPKNYMTVRKTIEHLEPLRAGETSARDPIHKASGLSDINLLRIRASKPGGTWRDWPEDLRAPCHTKRSGKTYPSVYGRMSWEEPSPTITTQCHGYGNGRFGHPEQDRAISLREAALLQTFPEGYQFVKPGEEIHFSVVGRLIGNAVPVGLGRVIAKSIRFHLESLGMIETEED